MGRQQAPSGHVSGCGQRGLRGGVGAQHHPPSVGKRRRPAHQLLERRVVGHGLRHRIECVEFQECIQKPSLPAQKIGANQLDGAGPVPKVHQDPRLSQRFVSRIGGKCFNVGHMVENPSRFLPISFRQDDLDEPRPGPPQTGVFFQDGSEEIFGLSESTGQKQQVGILGLENRPGVSVRSATSRFGLMRSTLGRWSLITRCANS